MPFSSTTAAAETGPTKVTIRLSAEPGEATLFLDGERVDGNPAGTDGFECVARIVLN